MYSGSFNATTQNYCKKRGRSYASSFTKRCSVIYRLALLVILLASPRDAKLNGNHIQHFIIRSFMRQYAPLVKLTECVDEIDFSYRKCITNFYDLHAVHKTKTKSVNLEYKQAFRYAVLPDIVAWKRLHANKRPSEDAVVDHVFPLTFVSLLDTFLRYWSAWVRYGKDSGFAFNDLPIRDDGDWLEDAYSSIDIIAGSRNTFFMPTLADTVMASMWREFHHTYATLRWLTPSQNARCNHRRDAFPEIKGIALR